MSTPQAATPISRTTAVWALTAAVCVAGGLAAAAAPPARGADKRTSRDTALADRYVPTPNPAHAAPNAGLDSALQLIYQCRSQFARAQDYTARFLKRERLDGELSEINHIELKVRQRPFSVYMRWVQPNEGREVLYVAGQRAGKLLAHDTGVTRFLTGTMELDPTGSLAMRTSRHPITEAGIGNLIERIVVGWQEDRQRGNTDAKILHGAQVQDRKCLCVQTRHPAYDARLQAHRLRLFIDEQLMVPIRIELYDWPRRGGSPEGELIEEYTYLNLRLNPRLTDLDFRRENPSYAF